ncbi:hypothetical protein ACFL2Q_06090 [Thermodesulfobacteriota bacterium]
MRWIPFKISTCDVFATHLNAYRHGPAGTDKLRSGGQLRGEYRKSRVWRAIANEFRACIGGSTEACTSPNCKLYPYRRGSGGWRTDQREGR